MHTVLILTDLHITPPGETIIGLDPGARLEAVLAQMKAQHPDADHLLILGDLVHFGTAQEYTRLRGLLSDLPWPVTYLLGNHDDRATFRACFPEAPTDAQGLVQSRITLPHAEIICLDTLAPKATPRHSGTLCPDRLAWLRDQLAQTPGIPKIIALHHPPFETGFTGMDRIGLTNREEVVDILASCPDVALVISGHIHRTIFASLAGLPMAVFKSPCHQMPLLLDTAGSGHSVDEPGAYGLLRIAPEGVISVHTNDVGVNESAPQNDAAST